MRMSDYAGMSPAKGLSSNLKPLSLNFCGLSHNLAGLPAQLAPTIAPNKEACGAA